MKTNNCKCGKPANQLVIIKGSAYYLCEKHVRALEKFLGEKLEPLTKNKVWSKTKNYESEEINI